MAYICLTLNVSRRGWKMCAVVEVRTCYQTSTSKVFCQNKYLISNITYITLMENMCVLPSCEHLWALHYLERNGCQVEKAVEVRTFTVPYRHKYGIFLRLYCALLCRLLLWQSWLCWREGARWRCSIRARTLSLSPSTSRPGTSSRASWPSSTPTPVRSIPSGDGTRGLI